MNIKIMKCWECGKGDLVKGDEEEEAKNFLQSDSVLNNYKILFCNNLDCWADIYWQAKLDDYEI